MCSSMSVAPSPSAVPHHLHRTTPPTSFPLSLIRFPECNAGYDIEYVFEVPFHPCSSFQTNLFFFRCSMEDADSGSGQTSTYNTSACPTSDFACIGPSPRISSRTESSILKNIFIMGLLNLRAMAMIFMHKL
ncbi:hypothetical protein VPH35_043427 [Triticum aestivum]